MHLPDAVRPAATPMSGPPRDRLDGLTRRAGIAAALFGMAGSLVARPALARSSLVHQALADGPADGPSGPLAQGATILIAGPPDGTLDRVASAILPPLTRALPHGSKVDRTNSGGIDGVTGANRFEARAAPDGLNVLVAPGSSALAWLIGERRAQFDVGHWVPVMAGATPCIIAGRMPVASLVPGARFRIAAASVAGPDVAALLGLYLLGIETSVVFGLRGRQAREALEQGGVDLVFVHGTRTSAQLADLAGFGAAPLFSLGAPRPDGQPARDPAAPELANLIELHERLHGALPSGPLYQAWCSAAAAASLAFLMALPQMTPAALIALWREAAATAVRSPDAAALVELADVHPMAAPAAITRVSGLAAPPESALALRQWLAGRFDWHPS